MRIARTYDSIYVIDHDGSVLSVYDKLHLVPFGEYLPFQDLMEKLGFSAAHQGPGQLRWASDAAAWRYQARRARYL